MAYICNVIRRSNISKDVNHFSLTTYANYEVFQPLFSVDLIEWFGSIRKLTKVCKNKLCPINLDMAATYHSLSKIKTIEQSIFCTNTIMQQHTPCSTGKFHHHQIPRSELHQGQAELTSPKILHGCYCHPRISTLCLHSGRQ